MTNMYQNCQSISDAIIADHRELEQVFASFTSTTDPMEKIKYASMFKWELARHTVGEELLVYPAIEKYLGKEGHAIAEHDRAEHELTKKQVRELEVGEPTEPDYAFILTQLMNNLRIHIEGEEQQLPSLEQAMPKGESKRMLQLFADTLSLVPAPDFPEIGGPLHSALALTNCPQDQLKQILGMQ